MLKSSKIVDLAIVCAYNLQTAYGFSHYLVAREIQRVFAENGVACKVYNYEEKVIPEKTVLFVGTCTANILSYLTRFHNKKLVLYATVEGFPRIAENAMEREVAKRIKVVAVSEYAQMCMEASRLRVDGVVYHGIDMKAKRCDPHFFDWIVGSWTKKRPVVLCVTGNMPRKGVDNFMLVSKLVQAEKDVCFILHSGGGPPPAVDVRGMQEQLQLSNFWFTNNYALYSTDKMNALYKACSVYIQPSFCEGFGIPMIEAFRWHKPVVAVDAQPYSEIVYHEKTGLLVPCLRVEAVNWMNQIQMNLHMYSVDDMADAVLRLLKGKNKTMKRAIGVHKGKFDSSRTYVKLLDYF